ncbi:hypothetical protein NLI96_g10493 [Meripilus lineatus]|uniref:Uncharacterized protein n=1 Tax=Meripilus lineatus TaxID=2056292 RepID=A0AAD5UTH9_9APHY|nr:hypothetical protein NLI96_g10493 [Physisporinus lineatus]
MSTSSASSPETINTGLPMVQSSLPHDKQAKIPGENVVLCSYELALATVQKLPPFISIKGLEFPHHQWSINMWNHARVIMDPLTELKLRIKAAEEDHSIGDLVTFALQQSMPLNLTAPIGQLTPTISSNFEKREDSPSYLEHSYVDLPLVYQPDHVALSI